jgi:hypothetical protein
MTGIISRVRLWASGNRASSHCWRACAWVSGERAAGRMRDGSSGLLPGCGKPAVASSIIWLIATAPALGAVVTLGVVGARAGDLTVPTLVGGGVGMLGGRSGVGVREDGGALAVTVMAGRVPLVPLISGSFVLAGLTVRGVAGMPGGRSGVGAGENGGAFAVTVVAGRVPIVPLISGSSVPSTTPCILAAKYLSRTRTNHGFRRKTVDAAGGRADAAGGVGLTDAGGARVRPVAMGGVTRRDGTGAVGVTSGTSNWSRCVTSTRRIDGIREPVGAGGGVTAGTLAGTGFGRATGGSSRQLCGLPPLKEDRS